MHWDDVKDRAMDDEQVFRWILIAGSAMVLPVGLYHRLQAAKTREKLDRRAEGLFILVTLRPVALLGMGGLIAYMINPVWMAWSAVALPAGLRWCGVGIGVLTAGLMFAVFRSLGPNLTDTVVTRAEHTLVTHGPYRWVRHPFYGAALLAVTANALTAANWFIALTGLTAYVLLRIRTNTEEAKLIERFGDDYRQYMARTGRFFPKIGK
jgi:protein-S-isoprenylcysteine O-methyltransferase Ste14